MRRRLLYSVSVRYERDIAFDGIFPTPAWYSNLTFASCTLACFQSISVCIWYLFSSQQLSCKLLRTFWTHIDKNGSSVRGNWEYRSRSENLSLNKSVTASSNVMDHYLYQVDFKWSFLVDGITSAPGKYATYYEHYPLATIDLARYSIIKNVIIFNHVDDYGDWIHNIEIRVGNSSVWSEMTTCGTYPEPSETGLYLPLNADHHVMEDTSL